MNSTTSVRLLLGTEHACGYLPERSARSAFIDPEFPLSAPRYGTLLAPPSFLYSCNQGPAHRGRQAGGWRGFAGIHRVWVGEEWEWHQPIQLGDQSVTWLRLRCG